MLILRIGDAITFFPASIYPWEYLGAGAAPREIVTRRVLP
jgi:hypothetical protein